MDLELAGRRVLVTGGASHIGRAITLAFAAEGASVAIADVDQPQAERTAADAVERGAPSAPVVTADLTDIDAATNAVATAADALGGLDVLVNNVGWTIMSLFRDDDPARWRRTLDTNLLTTITVTRAALDVMVPARGGAIVSISSDAAWGDSRTAVYGAAKAGVIAFARSIAHEHGRDGIRSNVVAPGLVLPAGDDDVGEQSLWRVGGQFTDEQVEWMRRRIPLGRLTASDDVASAVLFLASERVARQLTGQVISVSGGYRMPG